MRRVLVGVLFLGLMLACRRPEVEAFGRNPLPIAVTLQVQDDSSEARELSKDYAAALRARLATLVMVVPEGAASPDVSAELQVRISDLRRVHSEPSPTPAAVGVVTGVAVGVLSAMAGNRDAVFDGLFWGLWAGDSAAQSQEWDGFHPGYDSLNLSARVTLSQPGHREPIDSFSVNGDDVAEQMDLWPADLRDDARVREEEAKAFARVVARRFQERFHWLPLTEPRYWKPPQVLPQSLPEALPQPLPQALPPVPGTEPIPDSTLTPEQ